MVEAGLAAGGSAAGAKEEELEAPVAARAR